MKLVKISPSEVQVLQNIAKAAYTQNFANHWENNGLETYLENQFSHNRLEQDLNNPSIGYFLIKNEEKLVGFVKLNLNATLMQLNKATTCELEKIYVLPENKGRGLGKFAIRQVMDFCKSQRKKHLFLCVIDTNESAIAFYEKIGFQFHSKTTLIAENFKEELSGMNRMLIDL